MHSAHLSEHVFAECALVFSQFPHTIGYSSDVYVYFVCLEADGSCVVLRLMRSSSSCELSSIEFISAAEPSSLAPYSIACFRHSCSCMLCKFWSCSAHSFRVSSFVSVIELTVVCCFSCSAAFCRFSVSVAVS